MPPEVRVIGVEGMPEIQPGDDLAGLLVEDGEKITPKACYWGLRVEGFRDEHQRDAGEFLIWYVHSLLRLFAVTGYEPALELGRKLNVYLKESNFTEKGEFISFDVVNHFHTHTRALMCLVEQAVLDDRDLYADPHMNAQDFFQVLHHQDAGKTGLLLQRSQTPIQKPCLVPAGDNDRQVGRFRPTHCVLRKYRDCSGTT
mgnify:CR=1 FL=1